VFAINVVGSALLGVVMAEQWRHPRARVALHDAVGIGFCGGLTTFSTLAVEVARFLHDDRVALASAYALASMAASVIAVAAGAAALRQLRAVAQPLEAEP
jgi:CrcB protein